MRLQASQPLTESVQAIQRPLHDFGRKLVALEQAVGKADCFLDFVDDLDAAVAFLCHQQMKTVRTEVQGGELSVFWRERWISHCCR